ncbi:MAG TPA: MFS transporter, partial [Actinopolymorphaceae bacterium]
LPPGLELVTANSRIYLSGMVGTALAGVGGGGLAFFGAEWALRFAFVVYGIGTILAIRLPAQVDTVTDDETVGIGDVGRPRHGVPGLVVLALRANAAFRALTGFLIIFMAFLLREQPLDGVPVGLQVGVIAAAAGVGNLVGTSLGALAEARRPEVIVQALLAASVVITALGATFYGLIAIGALGLTAGFAQQLGKLSLDALIQRDVPEHVRNSVFARSETVLQLAWVLGGILAIVMPLIPQLGLGIAAVGLAIGLVLVRRTARK